MKRICIILITLVLILAFNLFAANKSKRYIFIDGGAYLLDVSLNFKKTKIYSKYLWEIFAIEANPYLKDLMPKEPGITVINKALWIKDGKLDFYLNTKNEEHSSPIKYYEENMRKKITVDCFDFSKWISRNFKKNDFIVIHFDIHGSEWAVLDKMLSDNTITYIDRLYVSFHPVGAEQPSWFSVDEFKEQNLSAKELVGVMTQGKENFKSEFEAVTWLNKSILPFRMYTGSMDSDVVERVWHIEQDFKKRLVEFSDAELMELLWGSEGQIIKRVILEKLYPNMTPKKHDKDQIAKKQIDMLKRITDSGIYVSPREINHAMENEIWDE